MIQLLRVSLSQKKKKKCSAHMVSGWIVDVTIHCNLILYFERKKKSVLSTRTKRVFWVLFFPCLSLSAKSRLGHMGKGGWGRRSSPSAISAAAKPNVPYSWACDLNSLSLLRCTCNDLLVAECRVAGKMWCRLCTGWRHVIIPPQCFVLHFQRRESRQEWARASAVLCLKKKTCKQKKDQ